MALCCFGWLYVAEQPGETCSWRNILVCAKHFWKEVNEDATHLLSSVEDPGIFEFSVSPHSIKLRGSFELVSGLGLQFNRLDEAGLESRKSAHRSLVITVYQDTERTPLKGIGVTCATDLAVSDKTQAITPMRASIVIFICINDISGIKV